MSSHILSGLQQRLVIHLVVMASLCAFFHTQGLAQWGPGGVGDTSTTALWLRADAGTSDTVDGNAISSWLDQGGNGNDVSQSTAAQRPLYRTSVINGYPAVQFDNSSTSGTNDFMSGSDDPTLDNTAGLTIISVVRPSFLGGNARNIISKRVNVGVDQSYMFFFYSNDYIWVDIVSNNDRFNTGTTSFSANNNYMLELVYDGSLAAASRSKVYSGQTLVKTSTESSSSIPNYNSPLVVGATHTGDNRPFGGYIAELIIYREALSTAEKIIVDNALSAKYNIALSANDIYQQDNPANGDFDHEVAGIGRHSSSDEHTDAKGQGRVRILQPSDLDDGEYLFWGHNGASDNALETSDVPAGMDARMQRVWRVSERSSAGSAVDVGSVNIRWDLSNLGAVAPTDLRLLVDTDGDGQFSDESALSGATYVGGSTYQFTGVTALTDGVRFTIGTINQVQTPLPVELLRFSAERLNEREAGFSWEVATEYNCDRYEVLDEHGALLCACVARGFSTTHLAYSCRAEVGESSSTAILRQWDFDGTQAYLAQAVIPKQSTRDGLRIFPTIVEPGQLLRLKGLEAMNGRLEVLDVLGIPQPGVQLLPAEGGLWIDVDALPAGWYVVRIGDQQAVFCCTGR